MRDAVCLASGGLDSTVCLALTVNLGYSPLAVFIDYGQINRDNEYAALQVTADQMKLPTPILLDLSGYGRVLRTGLTDANLDVVQDAFTPCRNLLFLVVAAGVAYHYGISKVIIGLLSEKTLIFPDQSDEFLRNSEDAIESALGVKVDIVAPLRDYLKSDVVQLASELGINRYYSCHAGTDPPCGVCIACKEYGG